MIFQPTDPLFEQTVRDTAVLMNDVEYRKNHLTPDFMKSCTSCIRELTMLLATAHAAQDSTQIACLLRSLLMLLRMLRNCLGLEPAICGRALTTTRLSNVLPTLLHTLTSEGGECMAVLTGLSQCLSALSQLLGNWTASCSEGAAAAWSCVFPDGVSLLLQNKAGAVWVPATMALYHCCRWDVDCSVQLCNRDQGRRLWATMLDRCMLDLDGEDESQGMKPLEWLPLLVSCVCLKQGLLLEVCNCLAEEEGRYVEAAGRASSSSHTVREMAWSPYHPILLHILAQEIQVLRDAKAVGFGVESTQQCSKSESHDSRAPTGEEYLPSNVGASHPDLTSTLTQPWVKTLRGLIQIMNAAAHTIASGDSFEGYGVNLPLLRTETQQPQRPPPICLAARHVLESAFEVIRQVLALEDQGSRLFGTDPLIHVLPPSASTPQGPPPTPCLPSAPSSNEDSEKLETKQLSVTQGLSQQSRTVDEGGSTAWETGAADNAGGGNVMASDAGCSGCGDVWGAVGSASGRGEVVSTAGMDTGCEDVVGLMLAMLLALEPIHAQREKRKLREAAQQQAVCSSKVNSTYDQTATEGTSLPPSTSAAVIMPVIPVLDSLVKGLPRLSPYLGYRADILSVLSNCTYQRPNVARHIASSFPGSVELILAQTQLDESSPVAREWALWAVRNLCAGSEEAQKRIQDLEVVSAINTPETRRMGIRLERDPITGKMKAVKETA
ncbi:hypothetical protein CEUSTIGMA_g6294.t1 [Chlamydomonas eustigma]|uniref:Ataxin-10 domain-containing protein n=1 Tax=Chlamydomonas eustigma TaxID=1157962 RepID=A0A250X732_9CHLO|nr:hypothetical protein CEUSTIGMA_g6294.t1 [Chlamydomonas eustigma]|eukprot:GAX78856.1 hypothetical protein CEUSTIGMA_g6294.t1 [Chlamydomonas eustigma]